MEYNNHINTLTICVVLLCFVVNPVLGVSQLNANDLVLEHTDTTLLENERLSVVQDGIALQVPVKLEIKHYRWMDQSKPWFRNINCVTLAPIDASISYSWTWWSNLQSGMFQLLSDKNCKTYMAWCESTNLNFADVSKPNDKQARLTEFRANNGKYPDVVIVPVAKMVPDVIQWGENAHYSDIKVRSITQEPDGKWIIKISPPKSDRVYILESDKTIELGWRLADK